MAKPKARAMTNAERSKLLLSPYIRNATPHSIQFTEEAKWLIWEKVTQGKSCVKVLLEDLKLPPIGHVYDIAGRLPANLKKELDRKGTFARLRPGPSYSKPLAREEEERLREKLLLDSQELEFLKKITAKANGGR
ncbi:MAG: hypothetical protein J6A47_02625 [Bacilli bacterium]|nr:hypothetical protein [Bacilli bacterium]